MAGSHSTASRDGLARKERAEKIALFRYQLIREAADDSVTTRQRGPMVKALAATVHPGPFGGTIQVSKDTIDRWIRAWRVGGFDGLKPKPRAQGMITPEQVLSLAAVLKREKPARTSAQVRRIMIDTPKSHPPAPTKPMTSNPPPALRSRILPGPRSRPWRS
ncbi:helix-turn-helix domain containing protein [Arthrobacter sp. A5]|uniref:helix-turn-helix domain containing protein n=1 Tax=Arthrobacter sp. A5 TaxID=576926 RepID=UPI003DA956E2